MPNEIITHEGRDRWVRMGANFGIYRDDDFHCYVPVTDVIVALHDYALARTKEVADLNRVLVTVGGRNEALTKSYIDLERENEGLRRERQSWSALLAKQPNESKLRAALNAATAICRCDKDKSYVCVLHRILADNPPEPAPVPMPEKVRCRHEGCPRIRYMPAEESRGLCLEHWSESPTPIDPQIVERMARWFARAEDGKPHIDEDDLEQWNEDFRAFLKALAPQEEKAAPKCCEREFLHAHMPDGSICWTSTVGGQGAPAQPSPVSAREKLVDALYLCFRWERTLSNSVRFRELADALINARKE